MLIIFNYIINVINQRKPCYFCSEKKGCSFCSPEITYEICEDNQPLIIMARQLDDTKK